MKNKKNSIIKNLKWTIKEIYIRDKKYIPVIMISMLLNGIETPVSLLLTQNIINIIQTGSDKADKLVFLAVVFVLYNLISIVYSNFISYYTMKFSLVFNLSLNKRILTKASRLKLKDYEDSDLYDMINRAEAQSQGTLLAFFNAFVGILTACITMAICLSMLAEFNLLIALIVIILPVIEFYITNSYNYKMFEIITARTNKMRKVWYYTYLLTYGEFFKELKVYSLFPHFIENFTTHTEAFNKQDLNVSKKNMIYLSVINFFKVVIDGILFLYFVFLGFIGKILIGNVITYIRILTQTRQNVEGVLQSIAIANKYSFYIDQLRKYLDLHEVQEDDLIKIENIKIIEVKNLSYKYENGSEYVLNKINLVIRKGETIAVLGENGSGKTTLIKILMGFYDDYEGSILINGIDLKKINKESLLSKISTLFQDFVKYQGSFRENICYGNLNIINEDNKIYSIVDKFGLSNLVDSSENKIDTALGNWLDNGKQISTGQWQKVALSRAFAKNADFYILDEPNSALDAISEHKLTVLYRELFHNKLGIIIAHKFNSFIKNVDKIVILDKGEIVGLGNHKELYDNNVFYTNLYNLSVS